MSQKSQEGEAREKATKVRDERVDELFAQTNELIDGLKDALAELRHRVEA